MADSLPDRGPVLSPVRAAAVPVAAALAAGPSVVQVGALGERFVQSGEQISTMQQHRCLILSLSGNDYFSLDEVGAYLWAALRQPCSLGELVERVLERYTIDRETCQTDLQRLLAALQQEHLISSC